MLDEPTIIPIIDDCSRDNFAFNILHYNSDNFNQRDSHNHAKYCCGNHDDNVKHDNVKHYSDKHDNDQHDNVKHDHVKHDNDSDNFW